MNLVNALSLKFKLFLLLGIVVLGLIVIGAVGYFNMHKMKKNLDALYFGSLVPVTELNRIPNTYNKELSNTFYQLKHSQITPAEATDKINLNRQNILTTWKSYVSHFKRDYELAYIEYANTEILNSTHYLKRLSDVIIRLQPQSISKLSTPTLIKNINNMNNIIRKIISYESEMAEYERKKLLETYDETIYKLAGLLIFVIFASIIVMSPIFHSIQAHQHSLVVASKKLHFANKKLEKASITDALTELHNRRYFNLIYNRELTRCIREEQSMAFMMLDIDYFKGYNDHYGHIEGDNALKKVAKAMRHTLKRPTDYLFRLGGEEFGVLITNINKDKAYSIAEKLRQNIQGLKIAHEISDVHDYVTISVGVVVLQPDRQIDPESIIHSADENLYYAKAQGRNKVILTGLIDKKNKSEESA